MTCNSPLNTDMAQFVCNSELGHEGKHQDKGLIGDQPYCMEWDDELAAKMLALYP